MAVSYTHLDVYKRQISYGVGVEKVFPVHSPSIATIEVVRHGFVRRAKLYLSLIHI